MEIKNLKVGSLQTNCYIISSNDDVVIIDPGGNTQEILQEAKRLGKTYRILNTHYHFDHTEANEELREKLKAKVLIHEEEKNYANFKVDTFLKSNDTLNIGDEEFKIIHTPGHTQGSICLLSNSVAFTGDTIFENGYGRTDFPGGDEQNMSNSLKKLCEILEEDMIMYAGHGNSFKWSKSFFLC